VQCGAALRPLPPTQGSSRPEERLPDTPVTLLLLLLPDAPHCCWPPTVAPKRHLVRGGKRKGEIIDILAGCSHPPPLHIIRHQGNHFL